MLALTRKEQKRCTIPRNKKSESDWIIISANENENELELPIKSQVWCIHIKVLRNIFFSVLQWNSNAREKLKLEQDNRKNEPKS